MTGVTCPYCGQACELERDSSVVYRRDYGPIWICYDCKAWVGCHQGTTQPKGTPANLRLRQLRIEAHELFDPLWQRKMKRDGVTAKEARFAAYDWLSRTMGLTPHSCHIGMMNAEQCCQVIDICERFYKRKGDE